MRIRIHSPGMNTLHRTVHNTNGTVVHLVISYCILCSWEMFYWVFFTLNLNYFSFHCSQFHETRVARAAHFLLFQLQLQTNSKSGSGSYFYPYSFSSSPVFPVVLVVPVVLVSLFVLLLLLLVVHVVIIFLDYGSRGHWLHPYIFFSKFEQSVPNFQT